MRTCMSKFSLEWMTSGLEELTLDPDAIVWEIYYSLLRIFPLSSVATQSSAMMRLSKAASLVLVAFCQSSSICLSCCSTPPACGALLFSAPWPTTRAEKTRVNSIAQIRDCFFILAPFPEGAGGYRQVTGNHAAFYFMAKRKSMEAAHATIFV